MKLIAAACHMASTCQSAPDKAYGAARAFAPSGKVAMDYLSTAVERVLSQGNCLAEAVDLIVSLSWSPDHLVSDPRIMGPRIGHPLQKKIGAHQAFVFDLMDTSLAKALYIVNQFAQAQNMRRILLVRADIGHGLQPDSASGFSIPDGAFALLLSPAAMDIPEQQRFYKRSLNQAAGPFQPLRVELNTRIEKETDKKGLLRFPVQPSLEETIQQVSCELVQLAGVAEKNWFCESWLTHQQGRPHCLGPFDLAYQLEMSLEHQSGRVLAISFDPFGLTVEGVELCLEGTSNGS